MRKHENCTTARTDLYDGKNGLTQPYQQRTLGLTKAVHRAQTPHEGQREAAFRLQSAP